MKKVCTLQWQKIASAKINGRYQTGSFYCQREQKMHMWLPFLLKIKIYKRMMMMIFREHLVLGTYARSFVFAIYFFVQCFISVLYKEGNILKARFDRLR